MWLRTHNNGRIMAVPYPQEVNAIPAILARHDSATQFAKLIVDQFDEMLAQSTGGAVSHGRGAAPLHRGPAVPPAPATPSTAPHRGPGRAALADHHRRHHQTRRKPIPPS